MKCKHSQGILSRNIQSGNVKCEQCDEVIGYVTSKQWEEMEAKEIIATAIKRGMK